MTDAERRLWYRLGAHRFAGEKFKRQVPIDVYVVDFRVLEPQACRRAGWRTAFGFGRRRNPRRPDQTKGLSHSSFLEQ
jgi:hypothetical protein